MTYDPIEDVLSFPSESERLERAIELLQFFTANDGEAIRFYREMYGFTYVQCRIFLILKRRKGGATTLDLMGAVLGESSSSDANIRTQIFHLKKKLPKKVSINAVGNGIYRMDGIKHIPECPPLSLEELAPTPVIKPWSKQEEMLLKVMLHRKSDRARIAVALNRTAGSIYRKTKELENGKI